MKSSIRSMKVIRMSGMLAERVLQRDPSVKIVYYTRDVRGMLASMSDLGRKQTLTGTLINIEETKLRNRSRDWCHRVRYDMNKYTQLAEQYSVMSMRYEDLALGPEDIVESLYDFIGKKVPIELKDWIGKNTQADKNDGKMGTRRNSSAVVEKWRTHLSKDAIAIINAECRDVLKYQHYPE